MLLDSIQILNEELECSRSKIINLISKQPIKKDSIEIIKDKDSLKFDFKSTVFF